MLGIKNIYKPKPLTSVAYLLQYSGSRVEHRDDSLKGSIMHKVEIQRSESKIFINLNLLLP